MRSRTIIYDDNPDFGGHQIMAAYAVEAMAESDAFAPLFYMNPENDLMRKRLRGIAAATGNLELRDFSLKTRKLQGVRNHFAQAAIARLRSEFERGQPRLLLCIQGEIEDSSQALLAAAALDLNCLSYIPIPHRMTVMKAKLGALRDRFNRYLFDLPDGFITICPAMAGLLRERGARQPIDIVYNGIDPARLQLVERAEARRKLGLPPQTFVLGMAGRIEFKQKRHDFLLKCINENPSAFEDVHFAVLGGGPDRAALGQMAESLGMSGRVSILPWSGAPNLFYSAIDMLALPSRFEGVPLVMLEALHCGIPVLASRRDGMRDILPEEWMFPPGRGDKLARSFARMRDGAADRSADMRAWVCANADLNVFKQRFLEVLNKWMSE